MGYWCYVEFNCKMSLMIVEYILNFEWVELRRRGREDYAKYAWNFLGIEKYIGGRLCNFQVALAFQRQTILWLFFAHFSCLPFPFLLLCQLLSCLSLDPKTLRSHRQTKKVENLRDGNFFCENKTEEESEEISPNTTVLSRRWENLRDSTEKIKIQLKFRLCHFNRPSRKNIFLFFSLKMVKAIGWFTVEEKYLKCLSYRVLRPPFLLTQQTESESTRITWH